MFLVLPDKLKYKTQVLRLMLKIYLEVINKKVAPKVHKYR
jgi:hypothetical protein